MEEEGQERERGTVRGDWLLYSEDAVVTLRHPLYLFQALENTPRIAVVSTYPNSGLLCGWGRKGLRGSLLVASVGTPTVASVVARLSVASDRTREALQEMKLFPAHFAKKPSSLTKNRLRNRDAKLTLNPGGPGGPVTPWSPTNPTLPGFPGLPGLPG